MKLNLPLDKNHPLVIWANSIRDCYGHPVYLVGSQLTDKKEPRDVDVVCAIPDDEFALRFGNANKWMEEGITGQYTEIRLKWIDECIKRWKEAVIETNLNIDFKIQPMCMFNEYQTMCHEMLTPYKLDTK